MKAAPQASPDMGAENARVVCVPVLLEVKKCKRQIPIPN